MHVLRADEELPLQHLAALFLRLPVCWAVLCLLLHLPTFWIFELSAAMERRNHDVSMKIFQVFNSPDFELSQKTEARSRMASLKHTHAHAVLSDLFFLFEHTVYPSVMYLSHSRFLA